MGIVYGNIVDADGELFEIVSLVPTPQCDYLVLGSRRVTFVCDAMDCRISTPA